MYCYGIVVFFLFNGSVITLFGERITGSEELFGSILISPPTL